jgi:hypothetical protein
MSTNDELWSIALPSGEIRKGTLDQLDDAFNAGLVNESSLVLAPGATEWTRLGDLAGLDAAAPAQPATLRPVMADLSELVEPARRRSRAPMIAGIVGGVLAVAAIAFVATSAGTAETKPTIAAAASAPPTASAPRPLASIGDDIPQRPLLTEAQKKALLEADEVRARLLKAKRDSEIKPTPHSAGVRDSSGFGDRKTGGKCTCRAGDPLCSCM